LPHPPSKDSRIFGRTVFDLIQGDLTEQKVDAIVNAANSSLLGGGGVDGAIHRVAGPALLEACRKIASERGPLPPGEAVLTPGYALPSRFVIHTVGPVWAGGSRGERGILARCYQSVFTIGRSEGLRSIAFPSLATGAFGCPIGEAAPVALGTTLGEVLKGGSVESVRFVLWSRSDYAAYSQALEELRP
jgi:O-acetyl-ADP-ribose deacetylase (regulator of RNase III)